jgi:hypothetical protein
MFIYINMPKVHQSEALVYSFPRTTSGGKYSVEPKKEVKFSSLSFKSRYIPKSERQM